MSFSRNILEEALSVTDLNINALAKKTGITRGSIYQVKQKGGGEFVGWAIEALLRLMEETKKGSAAKLITELITKG